MSCLSDEKSSLADAHVWLSVGKRIKLLKIILASAFFAGFLLSTKLWLTTREYPLSPLIPKLPPVSPPFDLLIFISLLALLILIALAARPFKYIAVFLLLAVALSLSDQSRWQPWFYQYVFMLAALCFHLGNDADDPDKQRAVLNTCRLIVAAIYFWSGIQKLNVSFIDRIFPSLVNPYLNYIFGAVNLFPRWLILTVPLLEISIGIGLLTRKFRKASVLLALTTHILILLLLIPLRRNSIVWPWNIAMAGFVVILFLRATDFSLREILLPKKFGFRMVVMLMFGMMPLLSFLNFWDSYLSATLYSGNAAHAVIYINESAKERLPSGIQRQVQQSRSTGKLLLNPNRWSLNELNVPAYPERRIFINVTKHICAFAFEPSEVSLVISGKPDWLNGSRERATYNCSDL